jgi:hypothetical protein
MALLAALHKPTSHGYWGHSERLYVMGSAYDRAPVVNLLTRYWGLCMAESNQKIFSSLRNATDWMYLLADAVNSHEAPALFAPQLFRFDAEPLRPCIDRNQTIQLS